MTARRLSFGDEMRKHLVDGIDKLDRAVGCTLGPGGRIVLIEDQFGKVIATKDGVTVARSAYLTDQREYLGCLLLQEAALKVADELGDGTTTTVVVGSELIRQAQKLVSSGHDPVALAYDIRKAAKDATNIIMANSIPVAGDHRWAALIAHVSGNADARVTDAVTKAFQWVGQNGVMLLSEGTGTETTVRCQGGFRIARGWPSPLLAPESGKIALADGAFVLIVNRVLYSGDDLIPCMQHAAEHGAGLIIVCENIVGSALETVVGNCRTDALRAIVVKPPGFDDRLFEFMHDLATWCGGTVQDLYTGMEGEIRPDLMGFVGSAEQDGKSTSMMDGACNQDDLANRVRALEQQRDTGNAYDRDKAVERLGRLRGRIATIEAGAATATEAVELKYRIEDALCAVRAAYLDGVQPGGGTALYRASWMLPMSPGGRALSFAMRAPSIRILRNAGTDPIALVRAMQDTHWGMGCDAYGLQCSMLSLPDPTAVVTGALRAAVSAATTLLTADAAVMLVEPEE